MSELDKKVFPLILILLLSLLGLWTWEGSQKLPSFSENTVFRVSTEVENFGQLLGYDLETEYEFSLTREGQMVNEYLLYENLQGKRFIYFLSMPIEASESSSNPLSNQTLTKLDIDTGKKREIDFPSQARIRQMYPEIVNQKIYFIGQNHLWAYDLRRKKWQAFYGDLPLQDISLSQNAQLILGANPLENFGYSLFPLQEAPQSSTPIGNYYQNFGFAPSGQKFLLKQKPEQDIFTQESFLVIFSADGSSEEILQGLGEITQALWKDEDNIISVIRDENFQESVLQTNLSQDQTSEILKSDSVQWIGLSQQKLWIVLENQTEPLDYDESEGISGLLESFVQLEKSYDIWSYDFKTQNLTPWPITGFFPKQF